MSDVAPRDANHQPTLLAVSNADGVSPVTLYADPTTHRLLTSATGGSAPTDAEYVVLATNATLTDERVLTGTANQITITDNGAGSTVVLSLPQSIATSSTPTFASMTLSGASSLTLGTASTSTGSVILKNATNANTVTIVSGVTSASYSLTLPTAQGGASTFLQNNGSGTLSWASGGTGDVVGPASSTDGVPALFDGTTGKLLKNSTPTGTGNPVLQTSPTLTTPTLGVASATSINKVALTAPATGSTLTIADGKTLTASNTLTFTGTDASSVNFGTGGTVLYTASTIPLTVGGTTIASGTTTKVLYDNAGVLGEYTVSGSGNVAMTTSPSFTTPTLGVASATSINKVAITAPATSATLTIADGKTLTANASLTLTGTDSTTLTFPSTSATVARTDAAQTFTGVQSMTSPDITTSLTTPSTTFSLVNATATTVNFAGAATTMAVGASTALITVGGNIIHSNNAIAASGNAATVPITHRCNTVTNNSAATLTITMTTTSAVDGQLSLVRILDASAVAQTITWVNTENSTVTAPTTSNGSTTLPLTVGFQFNNASGKWRCISKA